MALWPMGLLIHNIVQFQFIYKVGRQVVGRYLSCGQLSRYSFTKSLDCSAFSSRQVPTGMRKSSDKHFTYVGQVLLPRYLNLVLRNKVEIPRELNIINNLPRIGTYLPTISNKSERNIKIDKSYTDKHIPTVAYTQSPLLFKVG